jgi:hypothetical protein
VTRTRTLVAVLIVLVAAAGVALVSIARNGLHVDRGSTTHPGTIKGLDVQIDVGRVEVVAGVGTDAKVDLARHYLRGAPTITETVADGIVRVVATGCPGRVVLGCAVDVRVALPAATPVQVRTGAGAVSVDGMANGIDVATSGGSVRLSRTTGPVKVATSGGGVTGVDLAPTFLDATTSAGKVALSLTKPAARIDVRTGRGGIDLALPVTDGGYRVMTKTASGKVGVSVAQDLTSGRAVTATTGAGRIRIHPR